NMGSPSRIESDGPQAVVGRNSQNRRENKVFAAGSRLLRRAGDRISATGTRWVCDAHRDPRPSAETRSKSDGSALDQESKGWLVFAYTQEWKTVRHRVGVRGVSRAQEPQGRQTQSSKADVRRVASARLADGNSREVPQTFRHRVELSPMETSANLHVHAQSASAAGVLLCQPAAEKHVAVDSRT